MARFTADQVREKALAALKAHPQGMFSGELQTLIYGDTKNEDEFRRRQQHLGFAMLSLRKAGKVVKDGRMGRFTLSDGRPQPVISDLPPNPRRGRPKGSKNGVVQNGGSLRSYLIRSIRAQLAELEALD